MDLEYVKQCLGAEEHSETWATGWDSSVDTIPAGALEFLEPSRIVAARQQACLDGSYDEPLLAVASQVSKDPVLRSVAWHMYLSVCGKTSGDLLNWPPMTGLLSTPAGIFRLLIALAAAAKTVQEGTADNESRSAPPDIRRSCRPSYIEGDQQTGISAGALTRIQQRISGSSRVGRFNFTLHAFNGYFEIYRHRQTAKTMAVALDGVRFTDDGFMDEEPLTPGWVSKRTDDERLIIGSPISPRGWALQDEIRLSRDEWRLVAKPDDPFVSTHVPGDAPLDPDACLASMKQGAHFFAEYFPESPVNVFCCVSWVASPIVEQVLGGTGNLVRMQREAYLYPVPAGTNRYIERIFGPGPFDPATAPRTTSLQRKMLQFLEDGGAWRWGGWFFLVEGLSHFGTQWYRSNW